jgi:hypothetical protein
MRRKGACIALPMPVRNKNLGWVSLAALLVAVGAADAGASELCDECVAVRLEHPVVVRGPSRQEPDAPVSIIELPDGSFRAFAANATTVAIDGATPFALAGRARVVLGPGPAGSAAECGRWLTTVMQGRGFLYGLIHNEQHCNYREGETYKSMSIARSENQGLTWDVLGQIITGDEGSIAGRQGGEGDCTAVDGHDDYWYAYCQRLRDWKNTVARAPRDDPAPGKWKKWSGRGWDAPGLGGVAAALSGSLGMSSAYWTEADAVLLLATTSSLQLSMSRDKLHFATLSEPIILYDASEWKRPAPTDLYAYPSMVAEHGFNNIARHFFLTYTYIPPGRDFTQRYLVMHEASISLNSTPQRPQVRTALSQWRSADGGKWATTGPAISSDRSYAYDAHLGYVMTAPPKQIPSVKLDECFSARSGGGFLAEAGDCAGQGNERRRVAGYVFRFEQPGTIALYSCSSTDHARFVSNRADCDNAGLDERLLGFALR